MISDRCIKFKGKDGDVELKSEGTDQNTQVLELKGKERLFDKSSYGMVGQLYYVRDDKRRETPNNLQEVLKQFPRVCEEPRGLLSPRSHNPHIPLKEGAQSFKIRPNRRPFIQKSKIKKLVQEMMDSEIFQASNGPSASPVLLVKKKDGS